MLDYGTRAQEYFNYNTERLANDNYRSVKVVGGTLEDGFTNGVYKYGSNVTITAPAMDKDGKSFSCWNDSNGNPVSTRQTYTFAANSNAVYTAVYGEPITLSEFATFPEDRIISKAEMDGSNSITYYLNENGTEKFRSNFPVASNSDTVITATVTARRFRAYAQMNNGYTPTGIDEEQFKSGVLSDISQGINMSYGYAYYIEYTATMADNSTEKRTQIIILHDM